jgi:FAD/FMN-containing dehydrogenase
VNILKEFEKILGKDQIIAGEELEERYDHVWNTGQPLRAICALLPRTTDQVADILRNCHEFGQPVVIHGGLTNLVGGTETQTKEVVISLEKMNSIEEVDKESRTITVQAGTILEHVQLAARQHELLFPLNFGAKGSAQIGGVIATNAGGLQVLRYGMTRQLVVGLEAVLADGTVITSMKKLLKDNSGYDLKQLFIGSEGTLGVVTRAVLRLVEAPNSRISVLAGLENYNNVVSFLKFMDQGLAGTLSSFELMWPNTYKVLTTSPASVSPPLPYEYNYFVLLDSMGSNQKADLSRVQKLLEIAIKQEVIQEAVLAESASEVEKFWTIREDVEPMVAVCNNTQQFDISLPIPLIGETVEKIVNDLYKIPEVEKVFTFGHVADGNIHLVIGKADQNDELIHLINQTVYQPLKSMGGSISAEHGIGHHKKRYLHYSRSTEEIQLMKTLKLALDPGNILNPGKILDL